MRYKKELLRTTVLSDADGDHPVSPLRNVNLKDCCYMTAQSWNLISGSTLRILSNKLLGYNEIMKYSKQWKKSENEDDDVSDKSNKGPSHSETYSCLMVGLKWIKQQKRLGATQLID
ncbi:hypothetical protein T4B_10532 [Trichinella pseudospiralis]|uniref:Jerky-like protein-like n=1 Tax=Trichinella pseudospiralis TaxID=6337 RepID=A0A0V1JKM0_TRIPS|nr:hypothetical protein T4A_3111 [Trichinella pseudospiralis]KRZ35125.1 hypothetical protein T4B_10532 [Trichinella pseudospiralis]KRZ44170.1 hypothetical protein T4C_6182 [Trichinella pseudospiralis]